MEAFVSGNSESYNPPPVKVHATICSELTKLLDKIASILPALESAQPGNTQGLKALCSINRSIGKGKVIIQNCAEYSVLYLVLTGERVVARCERLRSSVTQNLSLIQNMVPLVLADQVSGVINDLNCIKFAIDPREAAAGKAISQLLDQMDSTDEIKSKTLQKAASNLNLTSQKSLLIEKRSIKKLLDQVSDSNPAKERLLRFLYNLLNKHAKNIKPVDIKIEQNQTDYQSESRVDTQETFKPDVSYHSVSSLKNGCMPLSEGNDENNENLYIEVSKDKKEVFSQILFPWNVDYVKDGSFSGFSPAKFLNFFKDLAGLEREKLKKAVKDVIFLLDRDIDTCYLMLTNGFEEALIEFLRMSCQPADEAAQEVGAQFFLAYLRNNRVEFPTFPEDILKIVTPFLGEETTEALLVLQKFSQYLYSAPYSPSQKLSSDDIDFLEICMEILCDLSSQEKTKSQVFSSGYLKVLAAVLSYEKVAVCSLKVLQIFSCSEEGTEQIGRNPKFISCLVELLETSTSDEKEIAVSILYSLCSLSHENCLVRDQFVVPPLVELAANGSEVAIEMANKLLQLLRNLRDDDGELGRGTGMVGTCTNEQLVSKTCPILSKKKGFFYRFLLLAHF